MPAVSVCDPVAATLRRTLEASQKKGTDELSTNLITSASRILQSEIQYKEVDDYQTTILDKLKAKYIVLSLTKSDKIEDTKSKDGTTYVKKNEGMSEGPTLPEPAVTLYCSKKVNLGWRKSFPVGAGMYNVGNTCYLNSTLQALFHVPALVNWLLSDSHHNSKCEQNDEGGECLTCAVAKTLQFSHQKSGGNIKPFCIYNKLKLICRTMVPGQQEDAHEFLRYLLEGMERAYLTRRKAGKLDNYSKETTPINQIFGGYIRTEVKCLQCGHVSTTFQHFQDLLVDIRKASTLDEALNSYFSREQLDNNDYKCEACKRRVPATKQFSLERAPKVLCVQLKRFSVLGGKISRHIDFSQTIDMGPYLWREPNEPLQQLTYKLMSLVTHVGESINSGHYTAVAQTSTGNYYSFDDSNVRPISLSNVLNTDAYIMIFEMEPNQGQINNQQAVKMNGMSSEKSVLSSSSSSKPVNPKASTSDIYNGSVNGSPINKSGIEGSKIGEQLSVQKNIELQLPVQKFTSISGTQLSQKSAEKSQPWLSGQFKKVLSGNSLVPYDGSSEEEETNSSVSNKNRVVTNVSALKINFAPTVANGAQKVSQVKDSLHKTVPTSKEIQILTVKQSNNSTSSSLNSSVQCTKIQNVSNGGNNSSLTSLKHQNGKSEINGKTENSNKEKSYHPIKMKTGQEEKVLTKAASSSIKGWEVSKDAFPSISNSTPNGWSVTDNKEDSTKCNQSNTTPSAAALRNFNGTNRSDTVSSLLKMSHRGYGGSSLVTNWRGNRCHLDREVDNERREERKRHMNPDDEEADRGRVKKVKEHRMCGDRLGGTGYNVFQEFQNGKTWSRSVSGYNRESYYDTSNNPRPRRNSNYKHPRNRHYSNSHVRWPRG
ncbi:PREDICTED: ubiquitin carboxyl-terminal hydrolase 36-like [Polistes dominula]|uniref:Ubiquitin carboxyl-terminal hydrolase n=1 Tax=Polistes dominula TaxID=743375 RepID=A0ABM1JAN7_POLDO|nr:PREDICTED: ubiquitin carboxyl-terminal hydrolase 36-like [Polistes dominula]XP_015189526.1 PREDICTED: ubiquitin carboxyl-terminal hydrolase 36-like [Polistes dominula]XP_015189527.1 PREDICTED: ubiquitin carboxyl-terminal hydrolase 36-like [Polistes dominula]XP_015189528.1 PREDICTED: ubiquitin carboxyl-terminal hydrolase 36-like [Polistes dominula]